MEGGEDWEKDGEWVENEDGSWVNLATGEKYDKNGDAAFRLRGLMTFIATAVGIATFI